MPLAAGSFVYQGDIVATSDDANVSITFTDRTVLSLNASSRMVLDQLVFAPGGTDGNPVVGNASNNVIIAGGPAAISAGAGDDRIAVSSTSFRRLDGGLGIDTLALDDSGLNLDLTAISNLRTESIEIIDLTGTGNNTLKLRASDVIDLSETLLAGSTPAPSHINLVVQGDTGDTVDLSDQGWQPAGQATIAGETYNVFTLTSAGDVLASVMVEQPVQVLNP